MFFLLISLKPTNCMLTANVLLYVAVVLYWALSFMAPVFLQLTETFGE